MTDESIQIITHMCSHDTYQEASVHLTTTHVIVWAVFPALFMLASNLNELWGLEFEVDRHFVVDYIRSLLQFFLTGEN